MCALCFDSNKCFLDTLGVVFIPEIFMSINYVFIALNKKCVPELVDIKNQATKLPLSPAGSFLQSHQQAPFAHHL